MNTKPFFLPLAAALALSALPARAQHDHGGHGGMHGDHAAKPSGLAAHGIAEGTVKDGVRVVEIAVTDDGYVPNKVKAKKGEKLRLVVTRKIEGKCSQEIVVKDHGITKELPVGKPVAIELTPAKSGELKFTCGMGHMSGVIFIP